MEKSCIMSSTEEKKVPHLSMVLEHEVIFLDVLAAVQTVTLVARAPNLDVSPGTLLHASIPASTFVEAACGLRALQAHHAIDALAPAARVTSPTNWIGYR
jgi:hypothetical protein